MTPAVTKALLGVALTLTLAPAALAAPAGDEYLPQEPTASAQQQSGGDSQAAGSSAAGDEQASGKQAKKGKEGNGEAAQKDAGGAVAATSSDDGGSSGALDILTDPVVLLLTAGVIVAAIGMTLRRREGGDGSGPHRAPRNPGSTPPPPEGEIVTGEPRP